MNKTIAVYENDKGLVGVLIKNNEAGVTFSCYHTGNAGKYNRAQAIVLLAKEMDATVTIECVTGEAQKLLLTCGSQYDVEVR